MPEPFRADTPLASATVTLLFTDIEGSTWLWEQDRERMSAALAGHDALARAAVESHRGAVVKMTGDGLCAAFVDPADALIAVLDLQRALADSATTNNVPLRVRCGLHAGVVERRDNDFFGPPLNRAARIMNAAHGGQVLLSQAVVDGVGGILPPAVSLRDMGKVRLKDLATPEQVYQLVHPDLRPDFPALRSLESTPNNLPQQGTSFVGREDEMDAIRAQLGRARLLTLIGMGGLGKTRLSIQVAADVMHEYPDGVWFLDLAPIRVPALVTGEASKLLGLREEPDRPLIQTLCAYLRTKRVLLILDNCEHLVQAAADLANAIVKAAPHVRLLASSRQALRIPGERVHPILPLPLPGAGDSLQAVLRSPAVQLFVDRAQAHRPSFALNEGEAPAVAALVTRLEGIPLALELAAARVRSLSVADINARLKDRYKILTGGTRIHDDRQQTLRALVDWSYGLLTEAEQTVLARLSAFAGGFDMPAAEAVCGAEPLLADDMLDLVDSLVEKSLVMLDDRDESMRFHMLETIRDYAREKLALSGELDTTLARHCEHYFVMAKAANPGLEGPDQANWVWRVEAELDNVRAAIALALAGGVDPVIAVKFAVAMQGFWVLRGYSTEGRAVIRAALQLPGIVASDVAHAWALYTGSCLAESQSDLAEALKMLERCLVLRRGLGNPVEIAATLSTTALVRLQTGDLAGAEVDEREALQIFVELGDRVGEAIGLLHLGQIAIYRGELDVARTLLEQCLAIARDIKTIDIEGECELHLGQAAVDGGAHDQAGRHFRRSLIVCRDGGGKRGEASALWHLGQLDLVGGDLASARTRLGEAMQFFSTFGMRAELLGSLEDCARLAHAECRHQTAARLVGAVELARERLSLKRPLKAEERWTEHVTALRATLPGSEFDAARGEGRQWQIEDARRHALSAQSEFVAG